MDYIAERERLEKRLLEFGQEHPGPMTGFAAFLKRLWKQSYWKRKSRS
jgi:hypothetical protein